MQTAQTQSSIRKIEITHEEKYIVLLKQLYEITRENGQPPQRVKLVAKKTIGPVEQKFFGEIQTIVYNAWVTEKLDNNERNPKIESSHQPSKLWFTMEKAYNLQERQKQREKRKKKCQKAESIQPRQRDEDTED